MINLKTNKKIGKAIGMLDILEHEMLLITEKGKVIRVKTEPLRSIGRATQGVRMMNLGEGDTICSIAKVLES